MNRYFISDAGFVVDRLFGLLELSTEHRFRFVGLIQLVGCLVSSVRQVDVLLMQSVLH